MQPIELSSLCDFENLFIFEIQKKSALEKANEPVKVNKEGTESINVE